MDTFKFKGFEVPKQNWSKLPHEFIDAMHLIKSLSEIKVILYVLRHTWGYAEYGKAKQITVDEFQFGRKRRDGTRLDKGTGLTPPSIRSGLEEAVSHGFLLVTVNDHDLGRVQKFYCLNVNYPENEQGENFLPPDEKDFAPRSQKSFPRTEKETKERDSKKEKKNSGGKNPPPPFTYKWPHDLEEIAVAFENLFDPPRHPLTKDEYVFWMNGNKKQARGFKHYVQFGITVPEMRFAYRQMKRDNLTVKSPNSLFAYAMDVHERMNGRVGEDDLKKKQAERRAEVERMESTTITE